MDTDGRGEGDPSAGGKPPVSPDRSFPIDTRGRNAHSILSVDRGRVDMSQGLWVGRVRRIAELPIVGRAVRAPVCARRPEDAVETP